MLNGGTLLRHGTVFTTFRRHWLRDIPSRATKTNDLIVIPLRGGSRKTLRLTLVAGTSPTWLGRLALWDRRSPIKCPFCMFFGDRSALRNLSTRTQNSFTAGPDKFRRRSQPSWESEFDSTNRSCPST